MPTPSKHEDEAVDDMEDEPNTKNVKSIENLRASADNRSFFQKL